MSSQQPRSRFWIYYWLIMIFMAVVALPRTSQVERIVQHACTRSE